MATGSKNIVAIKEATKTIETATALFKSKRISYEDYFTQVTSNLEKMASERDFAEYMKNIGYHEKLKAL